MSQPQAHQAPPHATAPTDRLSSATPVPAPGRLLVLAPAWPCVTTPAAQLRRRPRGARRLGAAAAARPGGGGDRRRGGRQRGGGHAAAYDQPQHVSSPAPNQARARVLGGSWLHSARHHARLRSSSVPPRDATKPTQMSSTRRTPSYDLFETRRAAHLRIAYARVTGGRGMPQLQLQLQLQRAPRGVRTDRGTHARGRSSGSGSAPLAACARGPRCVGHSPSSAPTPWTTVAPPDSAGLGFCTYWKRGGVSYI